MEPTIIFFIAVLIMSVVIHEVSHGFAAEKLGDPTARMAGRLTLNPIPHIDPLGSVIIPALLAFSGTGFIFGWAKPVPYNPYNLKNQKWGPAIVAAAGPLSNLFMALVFGLGIRFGSIYMTQSFLDVVEYIVIINILLAVFNSIPFPPLDGSKIISAILPYKYAYMLENLQQYSFLFIVIIVFFAWRIISPIIFFLFYIITGTFPS